jgi:hypothetical protein
MSVDRRRFLWEAPAGIFGFSQLAELAFAQNSQEAAPVDPKVVDFWVHGMGLPPAMVIGGARTRGRQPNGPSGDDFGREPLFLHHDARKGSLVTTDQIDPNQLMSGSDVNLSFQMVRMRLNQDDDKTFRNYQSGGIYVDMQPIPQQPAQSTSLLEEGIGFATSIFSAFGDAGKSSGKPAAGKSSSTGKNSSDSGGGKSSSKSRGASPAAAAGPADTGSSIPLQQTKQASSVLLPGGAGKTSFAVFAKDKKKTVFGNFISVFATLTNSPLFSYLPMLSMPVVGPATLTAMRSLVANLQAHGENQQWILMSPPMDVTTTKESAQQNPDAMRLAPGNYVVIPKAHSDAMKGQMDNLKVLDGFLVPKNAGPMDVYDAYQGAAPGVSYISLSVGAQQVKKSGK